MARYLVVDWTDGDSSVYGALSDYTGDDDVLDNLQEDEEILVAEIVTEPQLRARFEQDYPNGLVVNRDILGWADFDEHNSYTLHW